MDPRADDRRQRVLAVVDSIPAGRVATYGQVAREAHLAGRARLVGRYLAELSPASPLPWHRVVAAGGRIAPRAGGGATRQARRLAAEGVRLTARGRVDLARHGWAPDEPEPHVPPGAGPPSDPPRRSR